MISTPAAAMIAPEQPQGRPLETLKRMVDLAGDLTTDSRLMAETSRRYYDNFDNGQLSGAEKQVLQKRRQPIITVNRIRRKLDGMVGLEQRGRTDPIALPRTPDDERGADLATKALVFVDDVTRFDMKSSAVFYNLGIEGTGGVEIVAKTGRDGIDPDIVRIRWEEIFYDPHSRELDFSDATYVGFEKWMTIEAALEALRPQAPEKTDEELELMLEQSYAPATQQSEDRPREGVGMSSWGEKRSKRVRIAQMYHKHRGVWWRSVFCGGGIIYDAPSPYLDEMGNPECAIELQSCYIDADNRRYGVVMDMIPLQDEINKRRSKILHQLNSRQTMGHSGAVADVPKMKRELAAPDGHVEYEQDPTTNVPGFQIIPQTDQVAGQFSLLQENKSEIDSLGPNASLIGQMEGKQSGRAIMAQQQAGMAELSPLYDAHNEWKLRVHKKVWNRIKQYWTGPRWIRITDEDDAPQFIGLNVPVADPMTGGPAMDPMTGQPIVENAVAEMNVDIIIDTAPDMASLQSEEFQALTDAIQAGMPIPPEVWLEASSFRSKRKMLDKLAQAQQAPPDPMQEEMKRLSVQGATAKVNETEAKAAKLAAEATEVQLGNAVGAFRSASMGEL